MRKSVPINEDFGTILICAVRYSLGRQSYMPRLVQDYIRPLLPCLDKKTLYITQKDIEAAAQYPGGLGDEDIDRPGWISFLEAVKETQRDGK